MSALYFLFWLVSKTYDPGVFPLCRPTRSDVAVGRYAAGRSGRGDDESEATEHLPVTWEGLADYLRMLYPQAGVYYR